MSDTSESSRHETFPTGETPETPVSDTTAAMIKSLEEAHAAAAEAFEKAKAEQIRLIEARRQELRVAPPMDEQSFSDEIAAMLGEDKGFVKIEEILARHVFVREKLNSWMGKRDLPEGLERNEALALFYQNCIKVLEKKTAFSISLS